MVRKIEVYADGADLEAIARLAAAEGISGLTTNPSLMRKVGIKDYRSFAREVLAVAHGKPVSFEVLADDMAGMTRQALEIGSWGENVYVKVPVTNTCGESTSPVLVEMVRAGVKLNVTAVMTEQQVRESLYWLAGSHGNIVSIFAGRIADTGRDPAQLVRLASRLTSVTKILWASARQVFDVVVAENAGADIITLPAELIAKMQMFGRGLEAYSLETVRQFQRDAEGITL